MEQGLSSAELRITALRCEIAKLAYENACLRMDNARLEMIKEYLEEEVHNFQEWG